MKIYIKKHEAHAGKWIYDGYAKAWNFLGHEVDFYNELEDIKDNNDFYLMTLDSCIREENLSIIDNAKKTFLFVQPLKFEMPWGSHPNFVSSLDITLVNKINKKNVIKWTFCEKSKYYQEWEDVQTFPLAFDNISYTNFSKNKNYNFDVCFIGGRANNGFDEKYKIKDPMSGMKLYKIHGLKKIINFASNNFFLVDLLYLGIKNKFKIANYEIETKRNLKNSKVGFGFKTQLKMLKIFKFIF